MEQLDPEPRIAVVKRNSPAAEIGLEPGDRLLTINGQSIERHSQVRHALGPLHAGDAVELTVGEVTRRCRSARC